MHILPSRVHTESATPANGKVVFFAVVERTSKNAVNATLKGAFMGAPHQSAHPPLPCTSVWAVLHPIFFPLPPTPPLNPLALLFHHFRSSPALFFVQLGAQLGHTQAIPYACGQNVCIPQQKNRFGRCFWSEKLASSSSPSSAHSSDKKRAPPPPRRVLFMTSPLSSGPKFNEHASSKLEFGQEMKADLANSSA